MNTIQMRVLVKLVVPPLWSILVIWAAGIAFAIYALDRVGWSLMAVALLCAWITTKLNRRFYAQVLEYDLAADGLTIDSTLEELSRVIKVHVAACAQLGKEPFRSLDPAPYSYHVAWNDAVPAPELTMPNLKFPGLLLLDIEIAKV